MKRKKDDGICIYEIALDRLFLFLNGLSGKQLEFLNQQRQGSRRFHSALRGAALPSGPCPEICPAGLRRSGMMLTLNSDGGSEEPGLKRSHANLQSQSHRLCSCCPLCRGTCWAGMLPNWAGEIPAPGQVPHFTGHQQFQPKWWDSV